MNTVTKTSDISVMRKLLLSTTALLAAGQVMHAGQAHAVDDYADWDDVQIVGGQATVNDTGLGSTTIDQSTMRAVGEATELHIGKMGDVKINQTSGDSLFVGRVIGNHSDPTQILGKLSADGRVMIIDRNGVFFGQNSTVDAAGISVTTGDVSNADIMDGDENFTFSNFGDGEIVLEGTMNIKDAGLAAFVAPTVRNSGVINAKMGKVVFASGETVTIDLYGDGLVEVAVDGELGSALLENKGTIDAGGGNVIMTAQSAKNIVDSVINNESIIKVTSVEQKGGKIILSGGDNGKVTNTGVLDASGAQGGSIDVTGQAIELGADSEIKANGTNGDAGEINVIADETLLVAGKLEALGNNKSGFIETSAADVDFDSSTDISAGKWLLDPTSINVGTELAAIIEDQLEDGDAEITTPDDDNTEQGAITFFTVVEWDTANTFTANAINDIRFNGNSGLNATGAGNIVLNAGDDIRMYDNAFGVKTNGGNVTFNAAEEVTMRAGGIDAGGGNILVNNMGGGFFGFEDSLSTSGTGTITLTQRQDNLENSLGQATIQNAIDALNNTGTGQNNLNVAAGTYTENLEINQANLLLIGEEGATLQAAEAGEALIEVRAASATIDPFVFDGLRLVNYGIRATGDGTHGLYVDGNTFRNFKKGGVYIGYSNGAAAYINNNTFEGTMGHGIRTGTLNNGSVVYITNNTFGSDEDPLNYVGIDIGVQRNSDILIDNNDIVAQELGINFEYLGNGSEVEVADNSIEGIDENGIKFLGIEDSTVLISSNDKIVSENGTGISVDSGKFNDKILNNSTITIDGNTEIAGYGSYGVDFYEGDLAGGSTINITNNEYIHGFFDGIYVGDDVFGGVTVNINGNGVGAIIDDEYVVYSGISTDLGNGISLYGVETSDIRNNVIDGVGTDGIHLDDFGQTWIAYNYIYNTGDDGIEAIYGDFASVYGNTIEGVGIMSPIIFAEGPEFLIEEEREFGADGIHLRNVGGIEILPPAAEEGKDGFGYGSYGADSEIFDNDISIVADDGIEVINGNVAYIGDNIIGHVDGDGIAVEGTYVTEINGNVITLAGENGIYVNGFFFDEFPDDDDDEPLFLTLDDEYFNQGVYAGIFNNKILLTGSDGIEVFNIGGDFVPGDIDLVGAPDTGAYGWAVNIQGNEVAMTGDNGILAYSNDSVRAHENDIFMAGMGPDLGFTIDSINAFAAGIPPIFETPVLLAGNSDDWVGGGGDGEFSWLWGNGHGIAVYGTLGYGPTGESVDIQYNTVEATGGHGINVELADSARISYNNISYTGLEYTEFADASDMLDLLSSGPFDDHSGYFDPEEPVDTVESVVFIDSDDDEYGSGEYPSRRDLWTASGENINTILKEYITFGSEIEYDSYDGINVESVGSDIIVVPAIASGGVSVTPYDIPYAVTIQGNTIDHTGDDGIEVLFSGRTLIGGYGELEGNTITNAGYGFSSGGYGPDYKGADGIHVSEVFIDGFFPWVSEAGEGSYGSGDDPVEGYYGYAVDVIGNTIDNTQDDGVEVVFSESTLIDGNTITNVGVNSSDYSGRDGDRGSDGIHVDGVGQLRLMRANVEAGYGDSGLDHGGEIDPYAVVIIGNTIDSTQDDGIEVLNSGRTRIGGFTEGEENTISNVGVSYYDGDYGADGIHVRNVFSDVIFARPTLGGSVVQDPTDHFYDVQIINNSVTGTQDDGIEVLYSGDTLIQGNTLTDIGFVGPSIPLIEAFYIGDYESDYEYDGADGIHVVSEGDRMVRRVDIIEGPVYADYGYGTKVAIIDNTVTNAADDGIDTEGVNELLVDINTIEGAMDDGIRIIGYGGYGEVVSPEEELSVALAPQEIGFGGYEAVISSNGVTASGSDGIQTSGYDETEITGNTVVESTENGVYVSGFYNGNVLFQGNVLVNNGGFETIEGEEFLIGAGARFESGNIDFSDTTSPNIFINTTGEKAVAMQFDPAMMEDIYYYDKIAKIALEEIVPMEPILANLTIVNETLGSTTFSGYQPEGSFYVRFEDGAILDELGNVIVIDGLNASFEGLIPSEEGGVLPPTSLEFIEERLWDADDPVEDGRGQIFVGVAQDGLDNIQDFFNDFEGAGPEASGLNVTFLGLPNVDRPEPQNLEPAAGEGEEGSNVADIEPAAGGDEESEQVNCWSELTNTLQSGKSASISDDGTEQSVMNQTANCGAQQS